MVGRKPKPTAVKALAGNPGKRKLSATEPRFGGAAKCPAHLSKEARAEWDRVAEELAPAGLLTSVDRAALAAYCQTWARWCDAERQLQKSGVVLKSPKSGFPIQNPYVGIANTALDQLRKWATEFGMTPAARSRIHVEAPDEQTDPFAAFMATLGADEVDGGHSS